MRRVRCSNIAHAATDVSSRVSAPVRAAHPLKFAVMVIPTSTGCAIQQRLRVVPFAHSRDRRVRQVWMRVADDR